MVSPCTDPLPSIKIGGVGGVLYTAGYQTSASKGYSVTDVTGKSTYCTFNLHCLLYLRLYSNIIRSLQATPEH